MDLLLKTAKSFPDYPDIDYYKEKIYENLSYIYADQYFYKESKKWMEMSQKLAHKGRELNFQIKYANFLKKNGFHTKALIEFESLKQKIATSQDVPPMFKYRFWRDYARILAIQNRNQESDKAFAECETVLGDNCDQSVKYCKMLFFHGLALKRPNTSLALEKFLEAIALFQEVLQSEDNYFVSQCLLELGNCYKKLQRFDESEECITAAGKFIS